MAVAVAGAASGLEDGGFGADRDGGERLGDRDRLIIPGEAEDDLADLDRLADLGQQSADDARVGRGTSIVALSVMTSSRAWPRLTASPGLTSQRTSSAS